MKKFLPYAMPHINMSDKQAIIKTLDSGQLVLGPKTLEFETKLKKFLCAPHVIAVSSGTSALYLIAKSLDINSSHSVIVPSITFLATANAFAYCGAEIIFSDCDADTGLVTDKHIKDAIKKASKPVKLVVVVHLGGRLVDMKSLYNLSLEKNFDIVEDACHCFGTSTIQGDKEYKVGSCQYSTACSFSFHGTKNITTGEGGIITTKSEDIYRKSMALRHNGIDKNSPFKVKELSLDENNKINKWYYEINNISLNFKMSEINAALGISQLSRIQIFKKIRHEIRSFYDDQLKSFPYVNKIGNNKTVNFVDHLYQINIEFDKLKKNKNEIIEELSENGIGSQVHYIPIHLQPAYENVKKFQLPNSIKFYESTISIPFHNNMNLKSASRVIKTLKIILNDD